MGGEDKTPLTIEHQADGGNALEGRSLGQEALQLTGYEQALARKCYQAGYDLAVEMCTSITLVFVKTLQEPLKGRKKSFSIPRPSDGAEVWTNAQLETIQEITDWFGVDLLPLDLHLN